MTVPHNEALSHRFYQTIQNIFLALSHGSDFLRKFVNIFRHVARLFRSYTMMLLRRKLILQTTMHSSRKRTTRYLTYRGVSVQLGLCLGQVSVQWGLCPGGLCLESQWVFPKCFQQNQWQKIDITAEVLKPAISCIRDQDATTVLARHMLETGSLNWPQFMFQWFIWFHEFAEFTEFPFNLGQTPIFLCCLTC